MAVTKGRSARKPVKTAVVALLRAPSATTLAVPSGDAALAYRVEVHGYIPQRTAYPRVRVDLAPELPNSTMGINGKEVGVYVQVFDVYEGDDRILDIESRVIALMNPAGGYAALVVAGYRTEHVNYDGTDPQEPQDDAGKEVMQSTIKFTVRVQES